jgi:aryl-alcohol dehydrogenase-like predicted oxidoreductase
LGPSIQRFDVHYLKEPYEARASRTVLGGRAVRFLRTTRFVRSIKDECLDRLVPDRNTSEEALRLKQYADAHRTSPDVVAIAAALSNSWVDVVLSGAVTPEQLASNLRAVDLAQATGDWPEIAEPPNKYWSHSTLAWR